MHIFTADPAALKNANIPVPDLPSPMDNQAKAAVISAAQNEQLTHLATPLPNAPVAGLHPGPPMTAPRVTLFNNQPAEIYAVTFIPYVGELNIWGAGDKMIATPVIKYAYDGLAIHVQGRINSHDQGITLALSFKQMRFLKFVTQPDPKAPNDKRLSIQVALQDDDSAKTIVSVPSNSSALMAIAADEFAVISPTHLH